MKKLGKTKIMAIAGLSALALSVPIVLAQTTGTNQDKQATRGERGERHGKGRSGRGQEMQGGIHGMMFRGLNLTDDQKSKIKQISESFRERTQPLHQELQTKRQALRQADAGGTFNEAAATQTLTETAGLEAKLMGERFKMRQEMLSVLTPEQKTQLEQKRADFKARGAERRGRKGE
ncbi:MAG: periplasmic protein CpxP/Spy [Blastocatellia bacterium]|jgi:Spy/CpxP family protein refolding chaperone|nr:periplasmic protein CpxP/Spy [Blastocatellia bacterium]